MRQRNSIWSVSGSGELIERRVLGVWFYRRIIKQKWTPLMHEIERERGVRLGHRRFGMTETIRKFYDGKEPSIIRKAYP